MRLDIQRFADGTIIIGTEVDDSGLDKGIKDVEKKANKTDVDIVSKIDNKELDESISEIQAKLDKLREKAQQPFEIKGVKVTGGWNLSDEESAQYDKLSSQLNELKSKKEELTAKDKEIVRELSNQSQIINQQIQLIEQPIEPKVSLTEVQKLRIELRDMVRDYKLLEKKDIIDEEDVKDAEKLKQEIIETAKRIEELSGKRVDIKGLTDIKKVAPDVKNISLGLTDVIKKVGKWGLALFGIRSAYNFIRQSASTLSQSNKQLATDMQYISFALASTLKPVIEFIIKLVYRLLAVINLIAQRLFGVNLFANATTKAFMKQNKVMSGTAKSAKQLQKTLAGFDEMNVLQENGNVASGGGGGGGGTIQTPSLDLSNSMKAAEEWLEKVKKKFLDKEFWKNLGTKIGEWIGDFIANTLLNPQFWKDLGNTLWNIILTAFEFRESIRTAIKEKILQAFRVDPSDGLSIGEKLVIGIVEGFSSKWGWLTNPFHELIKTIKNILSGNSLSSVGTTLMNGLKNGINSAVNVVLGPFNTIKSKIQSAFNGLNVKDGITKAFKNAVNGAIDLVNKAIDSINKKLTINISSTISKILKAVGVKVNSGKYQLLTIPKVPRLAKGGIVNNPGPGVMMGNYIAGEKSPEAVIPLDDATMNRLGESIARHMVINATMINQMNGRVISRELQKINSQESFAGNW